MRDARRYVAHFFVLPLQEDIIRRDRSEICPVVFIKTQSMHPRAGHAGFATNSAQARSIAPSLPESTYQAR